MKIKAQYAPNLLKVRGCLIGGAAGDALGYPIEFKGDDYIFSKYGEGGMRAYELSGGRALVSDDTQMTLFTAAGLLRHTYIAMTGKAGFTESEYAKTVAEAYKDWYRTQMGSFEGVRREMERGAFKPSTWLSYVPELYSSRAPGNTCLSAIAKGCRGTFRRAANDSKGCGGVMRVAPAGLIFPDEPMKAAIVGARCAALTHGHKLGYLPAAVLSHAVATLVGGSSASVREAIQLAMRDVTACFGRSAALDVLDTLLQNAIRLAGTGVYSDTDCIHMLGEGWVAEEALAVAVYCSVRHQYDFESALASAVSHGGDSDSTGAITGNLLGAFLGIDAIPGHLVSSLEMLDVMLELSDDIVLLSAAPRHELADEVAVAMYDKYGRTVHAVYNPENKI